MYRVFLLFLLFAGRATIQAQLLEESSLQRFNNVEFYLFNGQYKEAYKICNELLVKHSDNKLLNFHLGLCCAKIKGKRTEAISYFRKAFASKDISYSSNISSIYIYLGKGVIVSVNDLKTGNAESDTFGFQLDPKKPYSNFCMSDNGKFLLFVNANASKNRILFTEKINEIWKNPIDITAQIGSEGDCFPSSISEDGKRIYITRYNSFESEIYLSIFNEKSWSDIKKLNSNINTKYWDAHAYESSDGKFLYFTSDRPGGFGGMDIYYSTKVGNDWGKPVNLGARINTFLNEDYPMLINKDKSLLFSSQGIKKGKDGFDIYYCDALGDNQWTAPDNLGYPINTEGDDYTYVPLIDAGRAFFTMIQGMKNGRSTTDTYQEINLLNIRGEVKHKGKMPNAGKGKIIVTDLILNKEIKTIEPDPGGNYNFLVREGEYIISYNCNGYETLVQDILVPFIVKDDTLKVNVDLKKKEPGQQE